MNHRLLIGLITSIALCAGHSAYAQTKVTERDNCSEFTALDASDEFQVTVMPSDSYGYVLTVDELLQPYCKDYIRNKTLYVTVDRKSVPKDTKKLYAGRSGKSATLKVVVYVPALSSITLSGDATFTTDGEFTSDKLDITLSDNGTIRKLDHEADVVNVKMDGKSIADLVMYAPEINVEAAGQSSLTLKYSCDNLNLTPSKGAKISADGQTDKVEIVSGGSSETVLKGSGNSINITGSNSSIVEAVDFSCKDAIVSLANSAEVTECAEDTLKVLLKGSSELWFEGQPVFDIVGISGSTLMPYSERK